MELDEILNPWIEQLNTAFNPYPAFIEQVCSELAELEKAQATLAVALLNAEAESTRLNHAMSAQTRALQEISNAETSEEEMQRKLQGFVVEVATLKSQLQSHVSELQSKQVQLEALKVQLEEQSGLRKAQQGKLEESEARAKTQDLNYRDMRAQVETLKAALQEAKALAASLEHSSEHEVPALSAPRVSTPRVSQPKGPALPERKVLLVDDAEINRVLMSHYFKGLPVKLHFAISMNAALEKCKEHQFDLVVVDDELQGLGETAFSQSGLKLVALSNRTGSIDSRPEFQHVLNRGQSREAFVEQLKSFLWTA
jgi:myosin heavy subunit